MSQISLYIDESTMKKVENAAKKQHISISKWVATQLHGCLDAAYPVGFENLFGSVKDGSFAEPGEIPFGADSKRETF